ncbi:GntP family permease [Oscillospiraceae bacterium OttesenSCG-928-G22]|nr:GntP family permease [Oscillospiraceae bacterium OttesenSCG-928-G22]
MSEHLLKILVFTLSMVLVFVAVFRLKLNAFLALLLGGIFLGLFSGLGGAETVGAITGGFGDTLASIGIVVALGVVFGYILYSAGCTEKIASLMLRKTGEKRAALALLLAGYVISIPIFFDAAIVILAPLVAAISRKSKQPMLFLMTALTMGMLGSLGMVVPAPGPTAVAGTLGLEIVPFVLYAIPLSLIGALISGLVYGKLVSRRSPPAPDDEATDADRADISGGPSEGLSFFLIIFPVVLILLCGILAMVVPDGAAPVFRFLGDKNIALLLSLLLALALLRKHFAKDIAALLGEASATAGPILLIMGAGGAYGAVVGASGTGESLVGMFTGLSLPPLVLAFLIAMLFRIAQGSATLSLVTTSAILAPMLPTLGVSPILLGFAICAGGMGLAMPNDAGYWVVRRYGGFDMMETLHCLSFSGFVSGGTIFLLTCLLSLFADVLPGL